MTTHATEAERLRRRLAATPGLVDVRMDIDFKPRATLEGLCGEANAMLDAVERGETTPLVFNDSRRPS